jgi:hypothetical protein
VVQKKFTNNTNRRIKQDPKTIPVSFGGEAGDDFEHNIGVQIGEAKSWFGKMGSEYGCWWVSLERR